MPSGFSGKPAEGILLEVTDALRKAAAKHSEAPLAGQGGGTVPNPALPIPRNFENPYAGGGGGGYTTGVGKHSNIVLDTAAYEGMSRKIAATDSLVSEGLRSAMQEIETLCETAYVMPQSRPSLLGLVGRLRSALGDSGALADEAGRLPLRLAGDLLSIT
ncbi:MAG: hypothetical protein LBR44_01890 [Clostridiales Family XIII bacterium]|jgi:hypothetical protein|nr:hypothetical protein [Clostridiales Family XIII bacterium]